MVSKSKIVVYIYLVIFCIGFIGVKDAEAANYDVKGFNETVIEGIKNQKKEIVVSQYNIASADINDLYYDLYYANPYLKEEECSMCHLLPLLVRTDCQLGFTIYDFQKALKLLQNS